MSKENNTINDKEFECVSGGIDNIGVHEQAILNNSNLSTAPELPATTLETEGYNGMFSDPTNPGQYEPHFYDGKVVDPTHFIKETLK